MSDVAIRVHEVSKRYRIGKQQAGRTLRQVLSEKLSRRPTQGTPDSDFWALHNVSFDILLGEVVGIIGHNGAGKSTLLKILSRITEPTSGRAEIYGRVGSLLEVGTGFHPELTGRENVYLSGAILGMKRREIDRKFDEIVAFAEVEKFIDTSVKHYSSGMYVRLAFSVSAHMDPEILIVDEVLSVGDARFQEKCLGKVRDVAYEGRTVLFVSHNLASVQRLCNRSILMEDGEVAYQGNSEEAIARYLQRAGTNAEPRADLKNLPRRTGHAPIISTLAFNDESGNDVDVVGCGRPLTLRIGYEHSQELTEPFFGVRFTTASGVNVIWVQTRLHGNEWRRLPRRGTLTCRIPVLPLVPGTYFVSPGCGSQGESLDVVERARKLTVVSNDYFGTGRLPNPIDALVLTDADWTVNVEEHPLSPSAP